MRTPTSLLAQKAPNITNRLAEPLLSQGLDYYKPTMSQLAYHTEPNAEVTFSFHNRGLQRLMDYVDITELQERFDTVQARGWSTAELQQLGALTLIGGQPAFTPSYLRYLDSHCLPDVNVEHDAAIDDLAITTTGPAPLVTFWETQVMSDVSEQYFKQYVAQHNLEPADIYLEGDVRLTEFIDILQQRPDITISDFGTRRRFSLNWQRHVLERLSAECPNNLAGTSNVALAQEYHIPLIGTFAHEMPMVYAGLADARSGGDPRAMRDSHQHFLADWQAQYGQNYSIALTDTFGTDFFFTDFQPEQAATWHGVRQDSGDARKFGKQLIHFYEHYGIDPAEKTIVFSNALDKAEIARLHDEFGGVFKDVYGIGTNLTNNLGLQALNIVMKATHVYDPASDRQADTVKLSDDDGKHTGPANKVRQYQTIFGSGD